MPYRNAEKWITKTIESVIMQDYADWELICIDDHSTDGSRGIVEQFAFKDPWIKSYTNPGKGIIDALQHGLRMSTGNYITRMDADDIMPQGRLTAFRNALYGAKSKTVVTGKVKYFSDNEVSPGYIKYENWLNERIEKRDHFDHIFRECVIASPNWMAQKEDLIKENIFEELIYPEDYSMTLQWHNKGFKIKSVNKETLHWREHPERTSRNSEIYDQQSFFKLKINYFIDLFSTETKRIGILGAGTKGKITADLLTERGIKFNWYDLEADKYSGKEQPILNHTKVCDPLLLVAIYPEPIGPIMDFLEKKGYKIGKNAWFL